jgi:hypothetical protein
VNGKGNELSGERLGRDDELPRPSLVLVLALALALAIGLLRSVCKIMYFGL